MEAGKWIEYILVIGGYECMVHDNVYLVHECVIQVCKLNQNMLFGNGKHSFSLYQILCINF